jgi:hypothetical protein
MMVLPKAICVFKIPMTFITETEKSTLSFIWKQKKIMNSQGSTEQKEQCWRYHNHNFKKCWRYHNHNFKLYYRAVTIKFVVLAQNQTWIPIDQNRRPIYKSTQLCPPAFWEKWPKHMMEKSQSLQQMLLRKLGICMQKTEIRSMSFSWYKSQLKVGWGL